MTAHAKSRTVGKSPRKAVHVHRLARSGVMLKRGMKAGGAILVPARIVSESLEDARLNAIADERADGPFVSVSLDDL